jgi:molybdate transport system ATP-binding protein
MSTLDIDIDHADAGGFTLRLSAALPMVGVTAIFGPSGSGKTTLLDCVAGLRRDLVGASIRFGGRRWQDASAWLPAWERAVGYVFQDARLFPHLDVAGNLAYAEARRRADGLSRESVIEWLDIQALLTRRVQTLSAGQAQRVAIARALLGAPRLLLLDEPLANLDRPSARHCLHCLARIARESRLPMLYVSHNVEEVATIADHLLLLRDGHCEAQGPLPGMLTRLEGELAAQEDAAAILHAQVLSFDADDGVAELMADGHRFLVTSEARPGDSRRLRVPARDVSVCRERPGDTSILNVLPVRLDGLRDLSTSHCLLRLALREQSLLARITQRSRRELKLQPGDALFAQIKGTALLDDPEPS